MLKLVLLWGGWCALHSLLISTVVRQWIEGKGGPWLGLYRLVYIGVAVVTLMPVLWYTASLPQQPFASPSFWVQMLRGILLLYATVLFVGGLRVYDLQAFLGLRQWRAYRQGKVSTPSVLNTSGILAYLRHPWYSGGIALLWGLPGLTNVSLVTRLILSVYLIIGAFLEERKMQSLLGDVYREYCRRTPMFIPWRLWRRDYS
ncbi:MAG: isoprenylcysteine carboxylmethyltransferase family protein [Desulfobulbus sp.]